MKLSLKDLQLLRKAVRIASEDGSLFGGFEESQIDDICDRLDREITRLASKSRVVELEGGSDDAAQIHSQPRPSS